MSSPPSPSAARGASPARRPTGSGQLDVRGDPHALATLCISSFGVYTKRQCVPAVSWSALPASVEGRVERGITELELELTSLDSQRSSSSTSLSIALPFAS